MNPSADQIFQIVTRHVFNKHLSISRIGHNLDGESSGGEDTLKSIEGEKRQVRRKYLEELKYRKLEQMPINPRPLEIIQERVENSNLSKREQRKRIEAQKRVVAFTERLEKMRIDEERKRQEEEEKAKRLQIERLYNDYKINKWLFLPNSKRLWDNPGKRDWEKKGYVNSYEYRLYLEEMYYTSSLTQLGEATRKLEIELLKMKDIIDKRYEEIRDNNLDYY